MSTIKTFITATDIGARLGLSAREAAAFALRAPNFPKPLVDTRAASDRTFRAEEVEAYFKDNPSPIMTLTEVSEFTGIGVATLKKISTDIPTSPKPLSGKKVLLFLRAEVLAHRY